MSDRTAHPKPPTPERPVEAYRRPTWFLDYEAPAVRAFIGEAVGDARDDRARAVRLFYRVRDAIRYDPYTVRLTPEAYRASAVARAPAAFCVPKAVLLAAAARGAGIPARLGFADVRNHLAGPRLRALMGTDLFVYHGFVELFLGGRWVKATPAFDQGLCDRFGVKPLEFDGIHDALLQPFDRAGRRHLEYVHDRGRYDDFPFEEMVRAFRATYPRLVDAVGAAGDAASEPEA